MTDRQLRFCEEYIVSGNATDAAIKAGYKEKWAGRYADKIKNTPCVKAYLEDHRNRFVQNKEKEAALILERLFYILMGGKIKATGIFNGVPYDYEKHPDERTMLEAMNMYMKRLGIDKPEESDRALEKLSEVLTKIDASMDD